ncbi:MAG: hypothetical protein IH606_00660 [Burkholderiales bacterium]|nr:hypothetical protein [Burkholderiales bacterium]
MNAATQIAEADPLYAQPLSERPLYATGMLLDAQDFADEQTYHRAQLARAMAFLAGGGTLAGLRVTHQAATAGPNAVTEEIRVEPGLAVDRLGRLIELPRPACLRLPRWYDAQNAIDGGDALRRSAYADLHRFLSARAIAAATLPDAAAVPDRAVVADVFLRFVACPRGLTPSFAAGPFDALNAVSTSRVRDAYELLLIQREGLDDAYDGLPAAPGAAVIGDATAEIAVRRDAAQDAVLAAYAVSGRSGNQGRLAPLPEHPAGIDPTAIFIARALIPVAPGDPPMRQGEAVLIDNWRRRFIPSASLVALLFGI